MVVSSDVLTRELNDNFISQVCQVKSRRSSLATLVSFGKSLVLFYFIDYYVLFLLCPVTKTTKTLKLQIKTIKIDCIYIHIIRINEEKKKVILFWDYKLYWLFCLCTLLSIFNHKEKKKVSLNCCDGYMHLEVFIVKNTIRRILTKFSRVSGGIPPAVPLVSPSLLMLIISFNKVNAKCSWILS